MFWENLRYELIGGILVELIFFLARKSLLITAPYVRIWKETSFLYGILRNQRFAQWKPQSARYVALRAIKARGAKQDSSQPVLNLLESFLQNREPVVLLGEPGAGKTTALEALTYRLARRAFLYNLSLWFGLLLIAGTLFRYASILVIPWLAAFFLWEPLIRRATVPIFLEARSDYAGGEVKEWRAKILQDRLGNKPLFGSPHHVTLLIDGVNEVTANLYDMFVEGWRSLLKNQRQNRIIFTSRVGEDPSEQLEINSVLTVCDLDDVGVKEFLQVYGREKVI